MYKYDENILMTCNATEIFGNIIFDDVAQTERVVFTDYNNQILFNKEYPLGSALIKILNCGVDVVKDTQNGLINYTINTKTGETLGELAKKTGLKNIFSDRFLLLDLIHLCGADKKDIEINLFPKVRPLYDELLRINYYVAGRDFLLRLNEFLKKGYCLISNQNIFLWCSLNYDDNIFAGEVEQISACMNEEITGFSDDEVFNEIVFDVCWKDTLIAIFRQLMFCVDFLNVYDKYINYVNYFCNNDFNDYLVELNNMQRAYLYFSNMEDSSMTMSDIQYSGIFHYGSSKTISIDIDEKIAALPMEKQAQIIKKYNVKSLESVVLDDIDRLLSASITKIIEDNIKVKQCKNCGKYFIPYNRSDTLYCDNIAPQNPAKSCKEYASQELYYEKVKSNPASKLHRNIYQQKQMLAKRNPDIAEYKSDFERFKTAAKEWKNKVKKGEAAENDYLQWLKDVKEKKVTY